MNKKGQVYLFAAVIVAVILVALTVVSNKYEQKKVNEEFRKLSENYNLESAKFLNALIQNPVDPDLDNTVEKKFYLFSAQFSSYAKAKDSEYELFYVYERNNNLYFGNFLDRKIEINGGMSPIEVYGCYEKLSANIEFGGFEFSSNSITYEDIEECVGKMAFIGGEINVCVIESATNKVCYRFEITSGKPQIMIVTGETDLQQRQVYIGGKGFVKGRDE